MSNENFYDTIVIGGGQAGLAAGYFLAQQEQRFVILDAGSRVGETWRGRWDSLHLFTPSQFDGLPGLPFPKPAFYFPTKDEVADYLQGYGDHFALPIEPRVRVDRLAQNGRGFQATAGADAYNARNVIVATGPYQTPRTPSFAAELDRNIVQLHSSGYHNPAQLPAGAVLVVGAGNSGVEIALELAAAGRQVWLAGRDVGRIPADTLGRPFGGRPYWWFISRVLSVDTPIGRKMRGQVLAHGNPLIQASRAEVVAAGISCTPRVSGVKDGCPQLEDGRVLPVEAVVWATGFSQDFSWIELPLFDDHGRPRHERGVVPEAPGLYFVGLHFQTALNSALLGGVGRDARFIVDQIARNGRLN